MPFDDAALVARELRHVLAHSGARSVRTRDGEQDLLVGSASHLEDNQFEMVLSRWDDGEIIEQRFVVSVVSTPDGG